MSKSLIIGGNGLVGGALLGALHERGENAIGTYFSRSVEGLIKADITDLESLDKLLMNVRPDVVYFAPNFSGGVNRIEEEQELATRFYLDPLGLLCDYCEQSGATLVLYSTDYIFGNNESEVFEDQRPAPLNYYGVLKSRSEELIRDRVEKHLILRTTNVFGLDPQTQTPNFLMQIISKLKSGEIIELDPDQIATPTFVGDLARASIELVQANAYGTYHIVGNEYTTRFLWAKRIAQGLGHDDTLVRANSFIIGKGVVRPTKLKLSNSKVKKTIGFRFHGIDESLEIIYSQLQDLK